MVRAIGADQAGAPAAAVSGLQPGRVLAGAERQPGHDGGEPPEAGPAVDEGLAVVRIAQRRVVDHEAVAALGGARLARELVAERAELHVAGGRQREGGRHARHVGPRGAGAQVAGRAGGLGVPHGVGLVGAHQDARPRLPGSPVAVEEADLRVRAVAGQRSDRVSPRTEYERLVDRELDVEARPVVLVDDTEPQLRIADVLAVDLEREADRAEVGGILGAVQYAAPPDVHQARVVEIDGHGQAGDSAPRPARDRPVGAVALEGPLDRRRRQARAAVLAAALAGLGAGAHAVAAGGRAVVRAGRGVLCAVADPVAAGGAAVVRARRRRLCQLTGAVAAEEVAVLGAAVHGLLVVAPPVTASTTATELLGRLDAGLVPAPPLHAAVRLEAADHHLAQREVAAALLPGVAAVAGAEAAVVRTRRAVLEALGAHPVAAGVRRHQAGPHQQARAAVGLRRVRVDGALARPPDELQLGRVGAGAELLAPPQDGVRPRVLRSGHVERLAPVRVAQRGPVDHEAVAAARPGLVSLAAADLEVHVPRIGEVEGDVEPGDVLPDCGLAQQRPPR